ncbi:MAG TPA: response regulator, partial [Candidatus Thermoplasmatota archaeon]|nr:response regulator [Candidatus Thermoplasmatota archaeon]
MGEPLRVLLVEDSEDDSTLLGLELRRGGYSPEVRRVETEEAMLSALVEGKWDIAIVDYSLPRFSALAALTLIRDSRLDLPVILVSGTVGEEAGAEAMQRGAA